MIMSTAYWTATSLKVAPHENGLQMVVKEAGWWAQMSAPNPDGGEDVSVYSWGSVPFGPPSQATFTKYENITQEMISAWIQEALGPQKVSQITKDLSERLSEALNPAIIEPELPWKMATTPPVISGADSLPEEPAQ